MRTEITPEKFARWAAEDAVWRDQAEAIKKEKEKEKTSRPLAGGHRKTGEHRQ